MNVEQARFNMIEQQIRPWDVLDTSVLGLLSAVRREDFVPAAHQAQAFMDLELPLGNGRSLLAPRVEARLVQDLNLSKRDTVLLVGAATGYVAALLAHKAQRVIGLESDAYDAGGNRDSDGGQSHARLSVYEVVSFAVERESKRRAGLV